MTVFVFFYKRFSQRMKINRRVIKEITPFWLAGMSADNVLGRENFTFAVEASLLGQIFIFGTITQPRTLSAYIPAA